MINSIIMLTKWKAIIIPFATPKEIINNSLKPYFNKTLTIASNNVFIKLLND